MLQLEGKVAVVTGAGRGLGRAIALAMSREGSRVTIMSRTLGQLNSVAHQMKEWGGEVLVFQGDVSDPDHVRRMVERTLERFSTVDVLVNNAAVIGPVRFLEDANMEAWKETVDINLNGAFYCTRRVAPIMVDKGKGKVINIISGLGQMPFPRFCAYSVTKAGMMQFTRSLAEELGAHNIQVNAIDPGVMDTPMQERLRALGPWVLGESIHRRFVEYKNAGHLRDPAEVASLAVFLASSSGDHLSGHCGGLGHYEGLGWVSR